jgi:hypothetical protein
MFEYVCRLAAIADTLVRDAIQGEGCFCQMNYVHCMCKFWENWELNFMSVGIKKRSMIGRITSLYTVLQEQM